MGPRSSLQRSTLLRQNSLAWIAVIATALIGIVLAWSVAERSDQQMRSQLLKNGVLVANGIRPADVRALTFTAKDRGTESFVHIADWMKQQRAVVGCRSVYSMVQRGEDIVFGPESLEPSDPLASAPGTIYRVPPPELQKVFSEKKAVAVGPYTDEYSTFVSAFAPVLDSVTGEVVLVVGLDFEASDWKINVGTDAALPISLAALVIALLILFEVLSLLRMRGIFLRETERRCHALFENSRDGIIMLGENGAIVEANQSAGRILGRTIDEIRALGATGIVADRDRLSSHLGTLFTDGQASGELELRDGTDKVIHAEVSSARFDESLGQVKAAMIFRDVSDRKLWEVEREKLIAELSDALANVRTLTGMLPICSHCKMIRRADGVWETMETYVCDRSHARFSHTVCPGCMETHYDLTLDEMDAWFKGDEQ